MKNCLECENYSVGTCNNKKCELINSFDCAAFKYDEDFGLTAVVFCDNKVLAQQIAEEFDEQDDCEFSEAVDRRDKQWFKIISKEWGPYEEDIVFADDDIEAWYNGK